MPYKIEVMKHIDDWSIEVSCVGAVNTVVNEDGKLVGHNTDWIAAHSLLARVSKASGLKNVCILGNGGYAKAVAHASRKLDLEYWHLCRNSWESIPNVSNAIVFNCTPVENIEVDGSNAFIDCITTTPSGKELAVIQAGEQFKLYTGKDFPLHFLKRAGIV
jgi:shikimate 5-dehydrogenase